MSNISSVPLQLSQVKPDFEALVLQLQLFLSQKQTWMDLLASSTGQTLIEQMAAVGAFNQYAIELAAREAFLDTALRDSSIYSIARMLGIRLSRRIPAEVTLEYLERDSSTEALTIPAYSSFTVNGKSFFNRTPIVFSKGKLRAQGSSYVEHTLNLPDVTVYPDSIKLYEGQLKLQVFKASNEEFRQIYLNEPDFIVSDKDVIVTLVRVDNDDIRHTWTKIIDGIWAAGSDQTVYYDDTDGNGDVVITFGDNIHGHQPDIGYNIEVKYAVTSGAGANTGTSGLPVILVGNESIKGITHSAIAKGLNQKNPIYYKVMGPKMYSARNRAISSNDYKTLALEFPNVASVSVITERDRLLEPDPDNPSQTLTPNLSRMNVVSVCILPIEGDSLTTQEKADFIDYMRQKQQAIVQLEIIDPIPVSNKEISVSVYIKNNGIADEIREAVTNNIKALFSRDMDTLGKNIVLSDIHTACTTVEGVDFVNVLKPTTNLVISPRFPKVRYFRLLDQNLTVTILYSQR